MNGADSKVLAVDLDGTLLRTDSLIESLLVLVREQPRALLQVPRALWQGRAVFKRWVSDRVQPDVARLPLETRLVEWLQDQRASGRRLVLVTAADQRLADRVGAHVGLFDEIIASDGVRNLKGAAKAHELVARFGERGFDYAGDSRADLAVWRVARRAILVGGTRLERAARALCEVEKVFPPQSARPRAMLRALRPHQWVKNLLLFLPLLAAHQITHVPTLLDAGLAFIAFALTASAVYLLNDLLDLSADRGHPSKRRRPFAAGDLSLIRGLALIPGLLLVAAFLAAVFLPPVFSAVLAGYFILTSAYSFWLKRQPILDVMTLAALYTLRVIAGAAAVSILPSFWLLAFSMFIFLSLALVKRYTELRGLLVRGELTASGRGWHVDDLPLAQSLGIASGMVCVLVLALYVDSAQAQRLYAMPEALWLVCPLVLYWVSRLWFKTHRGEMHDDPVVFALRDPTSLAIGVLTAFIMMLATFWPF